MSMPTSIHPMMAKEGKPFDSPDYLFETKWDGFRCLAFVQNGTLRLQSRNLKDITSHYPELSEISRKVQADEAVLDGELVCLVDGKPSFQGLQRRIRSTTPGAIEKLATQTPVVYVVFDLLYKDGLDLCPVPLQKRKDYLVKSIVSGQFLVVARHIIGEGKQFFRVNIEAGMEGIMAKALDSPYLPGKRSEYWLKIKHVRSIDAVIIGFVPKGRNLKSLILGAYLPTGRLVYIGLVGSGIDWQEGDNLVQVLGAAKRSSPPVSRWSQDVPKTAVWTNPAVVCTVEFFEFTSDGYLRHPRFIALRVDKEPRQCVVPAQYRHLWLE